MPAFAGMTAEYRTPICVELYFALRDDIGVFGQEGRAVIERLQGDVMSRQPGLDCIHPFLNNSHMFLAGRQEKSLDARLRGHDG